MTTETEKHEWLPEYDGAWSTATWLISGKKCRAHRGKCPNAAVAALNRGMRTSRGHRDSWWVYCEEHLYGRRIRNGVVECDYLVGSPAHAKAKARSDRSPA